jgi:hypothetical protein
MEQIYDIFPYQQLADLDFHLFLMNIIDKDQVMRSIDSSYSIVNQSEKESMQGFRCKSGCPSNQREETPETPDNLCGQFETLQELPRSATLSSDCPSYFPE